MKRCLVILLILAVALIMVGCSYKDTSKRTDSNSNDMERARRAANSYIEKLEAKQRNISFVSLSSGGRCSGDYYYIDCTVHFKDYSTRKGTIKILKNTSGSFEALGLDFH